MKRTEKTDVLGPVMVSLNVERTRVTIFGVRVATIYVEEMRQGRGLRRTRWIYFGPKNFGLGMSLPIVADHSGVADV